MSCESREEKYNKKEIQAKKGRTKENYMIMDSEEFIKINHKFRNKSEFA